MMWSACGSSFIVSLFNQRAVRRTPKVNLDRNVVRKNNQRFHIPGDGLPRVWSRLITLLQLSWETDH